MQDIDSIIRPLGVGDGQREVGCVREHTTVVVPLIPKRSSTRRADHKGGCRTQAHHLRYWLIGDANQLHNAKQRWSAGHT